jgi:CheY-like chemotaxis protein
MSRDQDNMCILIADDDEDDQLMLISAFRDIGFKGVLNTVNNGEELMDHLLKGKYPKEKPCLILLDLNMPKKDGRAALREIKRSSALQKIPVIIYTTSNNPEDISFSYEHGANSFVSKPSSYQDLRQIAETITRYWFEMAKLPTLK